MGEELWDKLFPFSIQIDRELRILHAGSSLKKLLPDIEGMFLEEVGQLIRPRICCADFDELLNAQDHLLIFKSHEGGHTLRGQVVQESDETLRFAMTLWVTDVEQILPLGLRLQDFALHDSVLDFLQLIKSKEIIAQDLQQQTEALREAKITAEKALSARQEFLSVMTHEIRTPLNAIIGMANILHEEEPREDQVEHLDTLRFSAQNLLSLVNDILDFSKMEAGKIALERQSVNIDRLIQELVKTFHPRTSKQTALVYMRDESLPSTFWTDGGRLSQILTNLLSNAIKFTESGTVKIATESLPCGQENCFKLRISVSDTGIGIAENRIKTIFEPFVQADAGISRMYGGTGLGLAITKELLRQFGSELVVESQVGEGSTFSFDLTFEVAPETDALGPADTPEPVDFGSAKVLLVEDNKVNQKIISRYLNKWNVAFEVAQNGQEALEKVQREPFGLILMDLRMPVMNGYEAASQIRALSDRRHQEVPIIALSASLFEEVEPQLKQVGMNDFLAKPFKIPDLKAVLAKYLPVESSVG